MSQPATSPYLSLRQAVRPGIFAHRLLAQDAERAGQLVADCEELLLLTRKLLQAGGLVRILGPAPGEHVPGEHVPGEQVPGEHVPGEHVPGEHGPGRHERFLQAYADAGLLWAKVVGNCMVLAGALLAAGEWGNVRLLAGFLAEAGEAGAAADVRGQLGQAVLAAHHEQFSGINNKMPAEEIGPAIKALRAVLLEVPEEANREINRLLVPLAASIYALMRQREIEIPYSSRVEHIATGGVAKYPDIVMISLDEIAAEFEGLC